MEDQGGGGGRSRGQSLFTAGQALPPPRTGAGWRQAGAHREVLFKVLWVDTTEPQYVLGGLGHALYQGPACMLLCKDEQRCKLGGEACRHPLLTGS